LKRYLSELISQIVIKKDKIEIKFGKAMQRHERNALLHTREIHRQMTDEVPRLEAHSCTEPRRAWHLLLSRLCKTHESPVPHHCSDRPRPHPRLQACNQTGSLTVTRRALWHFSPRITGAVPRRRVRGAGF
jgi:hypothetical protein